MKNIYILKRRKNISLFDKVWNSSEESNLHTQLRSLKRCSNNQVGFFPSLPANQKWGNPVTFSKHRKPKPNKQISKAA